MIYPIIFYPLGTIILIATALAVTCRNLVHAVLYLVVSFFGSAVMLYLLGAPFLAAMEVIIYAGAIMVLFLFIIMMIQLDDAAKALFPVRQLIPALVMAGLYALVGILLIIHDAPFASELLPAIAEPREFGRYVLRENWLMIEMISLLLLIALVGALCLGQPQPRSNGEEEER